MEIQTLRIDDYEAILNLWRKAGLPFKLNGRDSRLMIEKQMQAFPEFFLGAFHRGRLVGVVIGSYDFRLKGWINRLAVDPKYRRKGIAKKLVEKVESLLEKHGASIICALIETSNENSINLFQEMGYFKHPEILYVSKRKSENV